MPSIKQPKSLSHAVDESIVYRAGMLSVKLYQTFLRSPEGSDSSRAATALLTDRQETERPMV